MVSAALGQGASLDGRLDGEGEPRGAVAEDQRGGAPAVGPFARALVTERGVVRRRGGAGGKVGGELLGVYGAEGALRGRVAVPLQRGRRRCDSRRGAEDVAARKATEAFVRGGGRGARLFATFGGERQSQLQLHLLGRAHLGREGVWR